MNIKEIGSWRPWAKRGICKLCGRTPHQVSFPHHPDYDDAPDAIGSARFWVEETMQPLQCLKESAKERRVEKASKNSQLRFAAENFAAQPKRLTSRY